MYEGERDVTEKEYPPRFRNDGQDFRADGLVSGIYLTIAVTFDQVACPASQVRVSSPVDISWAVSES